MTDNGLEVKISINDYSKKTVDEKLDILYQVGLTQQQFCGTKTKEFDGRIDDTEVGRKLDRAKLAGIGIGSGTGAAALYSFIKSWIGGG